MNKKNNPLWDEEKQTLICECCYGTGKAKTVQKPVDFDPTTKEGKEKMKGKEDLAEMWTVIPCPVCKGTGVNQR